MVRIMIKLFHTFIDSMQLMVLLFAIVILNVVTLDAIVEKVHLKLRSKKDRFAYIFVILITTLLDFIIILNMIVVFGELK